MRMKVAGTGAGGDARKIKRKKSVGYIGINMETWEYV